MKRRTYLLTWLAFLLTVPAWSAELTTPEDYRRMALGMRLEGNYKLHWPGQKAASVSYKIDWNTARLSKSGPEFQGTVGSTLRTWTDRLWTNRRTSTLHVQNEDQPMPVDCVYVHGRENTDPDRILQHPRHVVKVYIVANDPDCDGPLNTDPSIYTANPQMWDTYLYYEIRDLADMLPTEPRLRLFRNDVNLMLDNRTGGAK